MLQVTWASISWLMADVVVLLASGAFLFAGVVLLRPFLKETGLSHPWWAIAVLLLRCLPGALLLIVAYTFASKAVCDLTVAHRQVASSAVNGVYATLTVGTAP